MKTYKFTIDGDIPSKKNSLRGSLNPAIVTYIRANKHRDISLKELYRFVTVRPSKTYEKWENDLVKSLMTMQESNLFLDNVELECKIFFPRKGRAGGDVDNKKTSILDALVKANILTDDHYEVIKRAIESGVYRKGEGGAEILIKDLDS